MKILSRKAEPDPAAVPPSLQIAAIAAKCASLQQQDKRLLDEQLILERGDTIAIAPRKPVDPAEIARLILIGDPPLIPPQPAGERLYRITIQRHAVALALQVLETKLKLARIAAMAAAMKDRAAAWREIQLIRVAAIKQLRQGNKAAEEFRHNLLRIGGVMPGMPGDFTTGDLFKMPCVGDKIYEYFRVLVKAGIVSQKEIDK